MCICFISILVFIIINGYSMTTNRSSNAEQTVNYSIEQFFEKFYIDDVGCMMQTYPYHAFFIMCSSIEFLGRCLQPNGSIFDNTMSSSKFYDAIKGFKSLNKYSIVKRVLYKNLRCGLVHALLPKNGTTLDEHNNLQNNVFEYVDLYDDIASAWQELKAMGCINLSTPALVINSSASASTISTLAAPIL